MFYIFLFWLIFGILTFFCQTRFCQWILFVVKSMDPVSLITWPAVAQLSDIIILTGHHTSRCLYFLHHHVIDTVLSKHQNHLCTSWECQINVVFVSCKPFTLSFSVLFYVGVSLLCCLWRLSIAFYLRLCSPYCFFDNEHLFIQKFEL